MFQSLRSRRAFLISAGAGTLGARLPALGQDEAAKPRRPRVAAIFTVFRFRSHAYNILENFLGPYYFNGELVDPGVDIVSFYADQMPADDMTREVADRFNIPLFPSIEQALCVGSDELAVDAVLSIGEHGDYPYSELGQRQYPRKRFFDESLAVMQRSNRFVPFFNDKHLSYRWDWAKEMFDITQQHEMPLLAGSSVPLAQRRPALELPRDVEIEEAVSIHGGGLESYDFHGLEVLQSFVEARSGGESGIAEVELLVGDAFDEARRSGRWSQELAGAAMSAETDMKAKRRLPPRVGLYAARPRQQPTYPAPSRPDGDYAICLTYKDGLKATVLKIGRSADRWNFACRLRGESKPVATAIFNSPWGNRGLFKALSHSIQYLFVEKKEPYPAARTLLTTGAVEAVMHSYARHSKVKTPHLEFAYQPIDFKSHREYGKSWQVITHETPQPSRFEPRPRSH
jgi:hypothetical protein